MIFSDSQAALEALSGPKVTSRLVLECQEALLALANRDDVTLIWVLGHQGILGNENTDNLQGKGQQHRYSVQSRPLEHQGAWRGKQLRTGLSFNSLPPGPTSQVANMANYS
jgi:hypothetical protein